MVNTLPYSAWKAPLTDREAWQATVYRVAKSLDTTEATLCAQTQDFSVPVAALPDELCVSCCLACRDPGGAKCAGTWTASATGVMAPSESFFEPLVTGNQKAS